MEEHLAARWGSELPLWSGGPSQAWLDSCMSPPRWGCWGWRLAPTKSSPGKGGLSPQILPLLSQVQRIRIRAQALHHLPGLLDQSYLENKSQS